MTHYDILSQGGPQVPLALKHQLDRANSKIGDPYYCQNSHFSKVKRKGFYPRKNITKTYTNGILGDFVQNIIISPLFLLASFRAPLPSPAIFTVTKLCFSLQPLGE